mgnify:CR=1 FL=1
MSDPIDEPWPEEVPIPLDHPLVPEPIFVAISEMYELGDTLHRVPTATGVEWWLFNAEGELIEGFWLE